MRRPLLLAAVFLAACSNSDGPSPLPELPPSLVMQASASSLYPDGSTVSCTFSIRVEWDAADLQRGDVVYTGRMGGESHRQVLDGNGDGLGFFADMAWPTATARLVRSDSISIDLTGGADASGSPFWDTFKALDGRKESGRWTGPWTCKPLGAIPGGYSDTSLTATGSWEITEPFVQRP
jgi:hypothetical protein